jgi:hypothetical protein
MKSMPWTEELRNRTKIKLLLSSTMSIRKKSVSRRSNQKNLSSRHDLSEEKRSQKQRDNYGHLSSKYWLPEGIAWTATTRSVGCQISCQVLHQPAAALIVQVLPGL